MIERILNFVIALLFLAAGSLIVAVIAKTIAATLKNG